MANSVNRHTQGNDVLSPEALQSLTGYKQPKKQRQWLATAGIWFMPGRRGHPSTTWYHVNHPLSSRHSLPASTSRTEPDFEAMCYGRKT